MTASEFWERHPSLRDDVFRFADEYAQFMVEEAATEWMERAGNWIRENQKLEARIEELGGVISE